MKDRKGRSSYYSFLFELPLWLLLAGVLGAIIFALVYFGFIYEGGAW